MSSYITPLCEIMERQGSDKGGSIHRTKHGHDYTIKYNDLFKDIRMDTLNIFELGLGTNNINFPASMGVNGIPGASLRGWREYFPNSMIFGADIDSDILFQEDRIKTVYCDQRSPTIISDMWKSLDTKFDIILEDGLHTFDASLCFLENSFDWLKDGGIFIIEDIIQHDIEKWNHELESWRQNHACEIHCVHYPPNIVNDNNLVIIKKNQK
jgi:SAM-dependent methyltransferase